MSFILQNKRNRASDPILLRSYVDRPNALGGCEKSQKRRRGAWIGDSLQLFLFCVLNRTKIFGVHQRGEALAKMHREKDIARFSHRPHERIVSGRIRQIGLREKDVEDDRPCITRVGEKVHHSGVNLAGPGPPPQGFHGAIIYQDEGEIRMCWQWAAVPDMKIIDFEFKRSEKPLVIGQCYQ